MYRYAYVTVNAIVLVNATKSQPFELKNCAKFIELPYCCQPHNQSKLRKVTNPPTTFYLPENSKKMRVETKFTVHPMCEKTGVTKVMITLIRSHTFKSTATSPFRNFLAIKLL